MNENEYQSKLELAKVKLREEINNFDNSPQLANYIPYKECNNTIYISGQLPKDILNNYNIITGRVESDEDILLAKYAAVNCGIQILKILNQHTDINKVECVQLQVFVNCSSSFGKQHLIANGVSDFICDFLQERGFHTRFAVGVSGLPLNAIVEVGSVFLK